MAQIFGFNPRRLKQFVNVFRLRVMIAVSTGVLAPAQQGHGGAPPAGGITIQQLGLFTAILMRWSRLVGDLVEEPKLFDKLVDKTNQPPTGIVAKWADDDELRNTIKLDQTYYLAGIDLKPLLTIMPDAYSGHLGERDTELARTQLVAGMSANLSPSALS